MKLLIICLLYLNPPMDTVAYKKFGYKRLPNKSKVDTVYFTLNHKKRLTIKIK